MNPENLFRRNHGTLELRQQLLLLLPGLLLVSGPPIWRGFMTRSLQDSATGQLDANIIAQLLVYAFAATLCIYNALRWGGIKLLPRRSAPVFFMLALVPGGFFLSLINAPSQLLTFAMSALFSIGWLTALQIAVFVGSGRVQLSTAILSFFAVNFALVILVLITNLLAPRVVAVFSFGMWRVRGNDVADLALAAAVSILGAIYLFIFHKKRAIPLIVIALGCYSILLPKFRAPVAALAFSLMAVLAYELKFNDRKITEKHRTSSILLPAFVLIPVMILLAGAVFSDEIFSFATRGGNLKSVTTISGRTLAWSWIEENSLWLIGHGYISGFRHDFQNLDLAEAAQFLHSGLRVTIMGNAHSTPYELVYGLGWIYGIATFSLIFVILILNPLKDLLLLNKYLVSRWQGFTFGIALLPATVMLTQSAYIMPPGHQFGTLMYAIGLSLGAHLTKNQSVKSFGMAPLEKNVNGHRISRPRQRYIGKTTNPHLR